MTEYGRCPAFGYECGYISIVEAQAAEIDRLKLECQAQYDRGYYDGRQNDGAEERAKIVAYLRNDKIVLSMDGSKEDVVASAIEAKEHLK